MLLTVPAVPEPKASSISTVFRPGHSIEETEDYIPWYGSRRLDWEDFRCEPKRNSDAVALTSTALGISYKMGNHGLSYEITCSFSKVKSWGLLKTSYILAHEQGHFDITEIFARKLHRELLKYKFSRRTFRQDVNLIYDRVVKEKEAFQEAYDGQTDHSRNKKLQQEWLERIDRILEDTAPYANYP
jgi:hypothetical protein